MEIRTFNELFTVTDKRSKLVVYGAGWAGKIIAGYLKQKGITITYFGVTQRKNGNPKEVDGIPVLEIDEVYEKMPLAGIILGAVSFTQREMESYLIEKGIKNYYPISEALLYEMRWEVFHYRAKECVYSDNKNEKKYKIGYLFPGYLDTKLRIQSI